jgi:hypothetical protein
MMLWRSKALPARAISLAAFRDERPKQRTKKKKRGFPRLLSCPLYAASTSVTEITVEPEDLMSAIQVRIHTPFALTGVIA